MSKHFVVIEVAGGVVEVTHCPNDVDVAILDHDSETPENECNHCEADFVRKAICDKCLESPKYNLQICYECGRSVAFGSGNFVNRIPNLDDYNIHLEMGVPYPKGAFVCDDCDNLR